MHQNLLFVYSLSPKILKYLFQKRKTYMGEIVIALNTENDIIYKLEKDISSDEEYCKKYLLAYSSLDILEDILVTTNKDFFYSINKHVAAVSIVLLRSGIRIMLVTEHRNKGEVHSIGKSIADAFREFLLSEWCDYNSMIVSERLDEYIKDVLNSNCVGVYDL